MRRFLLDGTVCDESDDRFQDLLMRAYRCKVRPLCLCCDPAVPMYIADIGDQLVMKRMPLTGGKHDPACPSYEPPYELSGLGPLMGGAIKLDPAAGTASLKLDFSLSMRGAVAKSDGTAVPTNSVKNEIRKLSLRGLLHFLWHVSGLTEWTAHWSGKRHWRQVYHHLGETARLMEVRGHALADRLLIPEPFRADDKAAIEQRRAQKFGHLFQAAPGPRKLLMLVGEIKEFAEARNGRQLVIKHMPGFRLYLEEPAWRSLQRRFEAELMLWQSTETSHMMAIMTIAGTAAGIVTVNEIAVMTVTEQWLPIENAYDQQLIERVARLRTRSVKGLRFNLSHSQPLANVILPEARPFPRALYIVPPDATEDFERMLREMIEARPDLVSWIWRVAEGEMPPLPPVR
jgi:hypothetical protein